MGPYVVSKHAVVGLTRTAALEAAQGGVRVNAICPGPIRTRMMDSIEAMMGPEDPAGVRGQFEMSAPMQRYGTPDEVASLVCWLLSDESGYVTGAIYPIDGGTTAG